MFIKNFRELIAYKKLLNLQKELLKKELEYSVLYAIKKDVCNIAGYIAQSQGTVLYPKQSIEHLNKAIKWTNILDKDLKVAELKENKKYKGIVGEIRKILISLRNKLEVKDYE